MTDQITILTLGLDHLDLLLAVEPGLFDNPIRPEQAEAFLSDPNHLMLVAMEGDAVTGFVSGVITYHPDKAPILFISEVGTRDSHQRRGIAKQLSNALLQLAKDKGCEGAWLATEADNIPARALYTALRGREIKDIVVYDWGDSGEP